MNIKILKRCLSCFFVLLCLFFINGTLFSFWAASGPPTEYPESYIQQGIFRLCLVIIFAVAVYFFTQSWKQIKEGKTNRFLIVVCIICALYPFIREHIKIDQCLDNGGSWSYGYFQ